jgi:hypothetical protein
MACLSGISAPKARVLARLTRRPVLDPFWLIIWLPAEMRLTRAREQLQARRRADCYIIPISALGLLVIAQQEQRAYQADR